MQKGILFAVWFFSVIGLTFLACQGEKKEVVKETPAACSCVAPDCECQCSDCECAAGEDCFCKACECSTPPAPDAPEGPDHDADGSGGGCDGGPCPAP